MMRCEAPIEDAYELDQTYDFMIEAAEAGADAFAGAAGALADEEFPKRDIAARMLDRAAGKLDNADTLAGQLETAGRPQKHRGTFRTLRQAAETLITEAETRPVGELRTYITKAIHILEATLQPEPEEDTKRVRLLVSQVADNLTPQPANDNRPPVPATSREQR